MKQTKVKFPVGKVESFASYCYDNKIETLVTWSKDDFFDCFIFAVIAIPDEFSETFRGGEFYKHVTT